MPRGIQHQEEFDRIGGMEHNVAIDQTDLFGPSRRFEEKSQMSNPSDGGGINRALKGKAQDQLRGQSSKQGKDAVRTFNSTSTGKHSPAAKHKGNGG